MSPDEIPTGGLAWGVVSIIVWGSRWLVERQKGGNEVKVEQIRADENANARLIAYLEQELKELRETVKGLREEVDELRIHERDCQTALENSRRDYRSLMAQFRALEERYNARFRHEGEDSPCP